MTTYTANIRNGDNVTWTLPHDFPHKAGGLIRHPAIDASRFYYVDMDGICCLDSSKSRDFDGLFTSDLSGCQSGFLVRYRAGRIVRMVLYHQSRKLTVFDDALKLFQDQSASQQLQDRLYILLVDFGSKPYTPDEFSGRGFHRVFRYRRDDDMTSFVLSFNGEAGEMSEAFNASRPEEKRVGYRGPKRQ